MGLNLPRLKPLPLPVDAFARLPLVYHNRYSDRVEAVVIRARTNVQPDDLAKATPKYRARAISQYLTGVHWSKTTDPKAFKERPVSFARAVAAFVLTRREGLSYAAAAVMIGTRAESVRKAVIKMEAENSDAINSINIIYRNINSIIIRTEDILA